MTRHTLILFAAILLLGGAVNSADMLDAVKSYQAGDYRNAAVGFRDVIADLSQADHHADAALLLGQTVAHNGPPRSDAFAADFADPAGADLRRKNFVRGFVGLLGVGWGGLVECVGKSF